MGSQESRIYRFAITKQDLILKTASANLLAMLNGPANALVMADCYTLTLLGGQVLRTTDFDVDLMLNGVVHSSSGVKFKRSRIRWVTGLEVDTLDITLYALPTDLLNGLPFLQQVRAGILNGAEIRLDRAYMTIGSTAAEGLQLFSGRVADVTAGRTEATIKVKSWLEILNIKMPRNQYQASCGNALFDSMCGLSKAAWAVAGTVSGISTATGFSSALTQAAGWFELGTVTFNSGANAGISRTVRAFSGGYFAFNLPWPNVPAAGDTFTAYTGCDRQLGTCLTKFSNLAHFRGQPFIPIPETAY